MEACDNAREAWEKLLDLVESMRTNAAKIEQLRKEHDDLLQAVEGFRTKRDLAHQEGTDVQQQKDLLEGEL